MMYCFSYLTLAWALPSGELAQFSLLYYVRAKSGQVRNFLATNKLVLNTRIKLLHLLASLGLVLVANLVATAVL